MIKFKSKFHNNYNYIFDQIKTVHLFSFYEDMSIFIEQ